MSPAAAADAEQDAANNVAIAFALTIGAGMATTLGAAIVFVPHLAKYAGQRRLLAGGLGFSAGVMMYVSFVDIFHESRARFLRANHPPNTAYILSTACFFFGVLAMAVRTTLHKYRPQRCTLKNT
jgi:zinc transporter, ZIP family